jgi:murein DD-endopeptidase MepM/ murein hydrolase activator NlpD
MRKFIFLICLWGGLGSFFYPTAPGYAQAGNLFLPLIFKNYDPAFYLEPLEFPFKTPGDIDYVAAFGIPNWSGPEPHNGLDLRITTATKIISPTKGTVVFIDISENPYSHPANQLLLSIVIQVTSKWRLNLVLEPSTIDEQLKVAQIGAVQVQVGQVVNPGDEIADLLRGELGYPHLHYMLYRVNEYFNADFFCPYKYSSTAAINTFKSLATLPGSYLPDGNLCYGEPN